jgi:hydroxymethylpyrimidine/phosphomethylpyrimidine kinase
MKSYQVFYWIKKNRHEYLEHMYVIAPNAKEACRICKEQVKEQTGRNAFRPTTKAPDVEAIRNNNYYIVD